MKTKYFAITVLAMLFGVIGYASDLPKMDVVISDTDKAALSFESDYPVPVELSVRKKNGEIVYYYKGEKPVTELSKVIETSDLGYGSFNVCINYVGKSINRELNISRKSVAIGPAVEMYEPVLRFENNSLNLSFLNLAQKNVSVEIYKGFHYLTGFKLGSDVDIQQSLDFSLLEEGEYKVVVCEHFKEHYFTVQK